MTESRQSPHQMSKPISSPLSSFRDLRARVLSVLLRDGTAESGLAGQRESRRLLAVLYQLRERGHAAAAEVLEGLVDRLLASEGLTEPHAALRLILELSNLSDDASRPAFGATMGRMLQSTGACTAAAPARWCSLTHL